MNETIFDKLDFGPLKPLLDNDDITDISYCNGGQIWIRSLTQGSIRVEVPGCTQEFMEKLAFQCSNVMGTTFNNAKPFLDAESSELRLNFVHQSIATNGIACVLRKTPAKIRLKKEKLLEDDYFTADIHDVLIKCVEGHCNIIVCGETGSGKTEFVKYLASHTKDNEKIITIEDTLELHLDKIFPHRDIVAMKTNNVASYSDVLVTCMRQNPKWILLSEVRSAEAVSAVRNSISSGHNILSTIHADKASAIPYRLYSLMETDLDVDQFLNTIYRYIQLGVHIKAYYSKKYGKFHREVDEVTEFYVDENNKCQTHTIYRKMFDKNPIMVKPSAHLIEYLENQNIDISSITSKLSDKPFEEELESEKKSEKNDNNNNTVESNSSSNEDMKQNESTPDGNTIFPSDISTNKAIISNEIKKDNDTLPLQTNLSSIMPNLQNNEVKSSTPNLENSNNIDSPLQSSDATKDFSFTGKDLFTNNQRQQVVEPKVDNSINQMMGQQNNVNLDMNNIFDGMEKEEQQSSQKPENQPPGVINTIDINSLLNDSNV
jgi:pilus assembly protein CpaF